MVQRTIHSYENPTFDGYATPGEKLIINIIVIVVAVISAIISLIILAVITEWIMRRFQKKKFPEKA